MYHSLKSGSFIVFVLLSQILHGQGTGLQFDEKAYRNVPEEEFPMGFGDNLPASFSLRQFVPFVAHQGQYGTCVGWSTTYYAATIEYARMKGIADQRLISALAFDPYYTYLNITKEQDYFACSEGTLITHAAEFLRRKGVKRFLYNSLECGARIDSSNKMENVVMRFTEFKRLVDHRTLAEENVNNVKKALSEGHPVIIGMGLPKSFYAIDSTGLFKPLEEEKQFVTDYGGHAMAVIGYDDTRYGGTFEIVNSWGKDWGDSGFAYVSYDDFIAFTRMAIRFETELIISELPDNGCVLGNCEDGYGRMIYEDKSVYEGNFVAAERSGYGLFIWSNDQTSFGGEWNRSKRHGKGILVANSGAVQHGYWKEDTFVKNEVVINPVINAQLLTDIARNINYLDLKELTGLLQDKQLVDTLIARLKPGCIYGDCQDGSGVLLGQNYVYAGTFKNGLRNGYGEMRWTGSSWGNAYIGNAESNTRNGIGAYFWPNGNRYYGEWKNGNREGYGTFFNANGEIQAGKFENNTYLSEGLGFGSIEQDKTLDDPSNAPPFLEDKMTNQPIPIPIKSKKKRKN